MLDKGAKHDEVVLGGSRGRMLDVRPFDRLREIEKEDREEGGNRRLMQGSGSGAVRCVQHHVPPG
ncbi:MAG: hypothetical protein ACXWCY_00455 [Burkholderiales bacterium]